MFSLTKGAMCLVNEKRSTHGGKLKLYSLSSFGNFSVRYDAHGKMVDICHIYSPILESITCKILLVQHGQERFEQFSGSYNVDVELFLDFGEHHS